MENENINKIGQDFSTFGLFIFTLPSFFMNVFTQIFKSLDDALFVSRYVGEKALAALNLLSPINCLHLGISHLFSLGSANISARLMGEGKQNEAKQVFTRVVISAGIFGIIFALLLNIFPKQLLTLLGADETLIGYDFYVLKIVYGIAPITLINSVFSAYFSTSGKTNMGMICSIANGFTNIFLDIILVAQLRLGVIGTCLATAIGELIVFIIGLCFFCNKKHEIHFVKPDGKYLETCLESASYALPQFINSISIGIVSLFTNHLLLSMIGSDGVAANAVISDVRSIITSGLIGVSTSCGPIVAYNYGNRNPVKLKKVLISLLQIWLIGSILLVSIGLIFKKPLINIYMSENSSDYFYELALFGFMIETFSVPFTSGCVAISRIFIALNNKKAAAFLSISRNLVFRVIVLLTLPKIFGDIGIFLSIPIGEAISFILGITLLYINRDNYGYGRSGIANLIN